MPTYTVTVARVVMQTTQITVFDGDEDGARNTVLGKIVDRDEMIDKAIWTDEVVEQEEIFSVVPVDNPYLMDKLRNEFEIRLGVRSCRAVTRLDQDGDSVQVLLAPIGRHFRVNGSPVYPFNSVDTFEGYYREGIAVLIDGLEDCEQGGDCSACRWERQQRVYSGEE